MIRAQLHHILIWECDRFISMDISGYISCNVLDLFSWKKIKKKLLQLFRPLLPPQAYRPHWQELPLKLIYAINYECNPSHCVLCYSYGPPNSWAGPFPATLSIHTNHFSFCFLLLSAFSYHTFIQPLIMMTFLPYFTGLSDCSHVVSW